jgi:membrane-associated HD superfamily phosphohydrolase
MKKNILIKTICVVSFALLYSCNNEELNEQKEKPMEVSNNLNYKKDTELKENFGKALAKALSQSQELREFLKTEALQQITKDYDVIYQVIKNQDITGIQRRSGNALTIRDILLPFFQDEAELIEIENALPLLTIFIPDLQEGSFLRQIGILQLKFRL